jgi:hypothetical protein
LGERLLGRGRLVARVGEGRVDRLRELDRSLGILDAQDVPADESLAELPRLVEVVVVEEEVGLVDGRLATGVDRGDRELPAGRAVLLAPDGRLDRDAVADLPAVPCAVVSTRTPSRSSIHARL